MRASSRAKQRKAGLHVFPAKTPIAAAQYFSRKLFTATHDVTFFSKIFLRISERNEYAIRQPSVSAIRFEVRVYKKSKNLNDAAFAPNG
jgi:hypothetical protein